MGTQEFKSALSHEMGCNYRLGNDLNEVAISHDRFGIVGNVHNYARSCRFETRTVQTFVCMDMSVYIGFGSNY
jgi:hypothetical protein